MISGLKIAANRRILAYLLVSALLLGLILVLGILPLRQEISSLEQQQTHLEEKIQAQNTLKPIYKNLKQKLQEKEEYLIETNLNQKEIKFSVENTSKILHRWASKAKIKQANFSPKPDSLKKEDKLLLVTGGMQGGYQEFRNFLVHLIKHPKFKKLELLRVDSTSMAPIYSLQFSVHLE